MDLKGVGGETAGNVRLADQNGVLVDAIEFGSQAPNFAIGRVGGSWTLTNPTVGADNVAATAAPAAGNLVINEWLSDSLPGGTDWIEIYNKHATLPVTLQGLYFQTDTQLYRYPTLSFVGPQSYLQLFANEQPGTNQLDFKLPATGTSLSILDAGGSAIDTLSASQFGTPAQGVSRGRLPDGSATLATFTGTPSPGAANYLNTYAGPMVNEVLARNVTGAQTPWGTRAGWVELFNAGASSFDLSGMKLTKTNSLTGVVPFPLPIWTFPYGTSIAAGGYLAGWCDATQSASASFSADMNTGFALGDVSGGVYLFNAAGQLVSTVEYGFQIADRSFGLSAGTMKLLASPTRAAANSAAATLGVVTNLRINEWLALQTAPTATDWFELYNLDANPVAMAGLYLTDDPSELGRTKFAIPALSFIDGHGWVKWEADSAPELGRNHVNFNLSGSGEYLRISNNDASFTAIDTVSYGLQTLDVSQGRIPDGASNIVAMPGSPTPGAKNVLLPAPSFTLQPTGQTVAQGANVTLTVAANGSAPLTYQWRFNNTDLGGATGTSLILNGVTPANDGAYTCIATNTAGSVPSNSALLIVQSTYAQWAAYYGLTSPAAATTADPDGDGLTNLQEFTHHLSPTLAATAADRTALPIPNIEPGNPPYLTLTYRRSARALLTGLDHQLSPTLANGSWSTVAPNVTEPLSPDPVTGDPRYRVKFTIAPGETAKFLRLLLTP